jgi:hypothetical protein
MKFSSRLLFAIHQRYVLLLMGRSRAARVRTIELSIRRRRTAAAVNTLCQVGKTQNGSTSRPYCASLTQLVDLVLFLLSLQMVGPRAFVPFLAVARSLFFGPRLTNVDPFMRSSRRPTRNRTLGDDEGNQGKKSLFCSSS